jgi:hypothetical protein
MTFLEDMLDLMCHSIINSQRFGSIPAFQCQIKNQWRVSRETKEKQPRTEINIYPRSHEFRD